MGWLHPVEAYNKKVNENRRDRTAQAIAAVIAAGRDESSFSFRIKQEFILNCHILGIAERVSAKLADLGITDWQFNLEAAQAIGQTNEGDGYGNFRPTWQQLALVFERREPAALAEVRVLQPHPALAIPSHLLESEPLAA